MPDNENENSTPPSGEIQKPQSLREVAEAAWDEVVEDAPQEEAPEPEVDTSGRQRDEYGRFVKAEPGEAAAEEPPSPETIEAPSAERPTQPPPGVAAGAPENWSQADKEMYAKAPAEMKAWALRRHSEMEGDYQRKVQSYAAAAQFAQAVEPVFRDPAIRASLQQMGVSPPQAIDQWGGFHKRAISPNLVDRANLVLDLAQRIGVPLNPAAIGQPTSPSGHQLPPEAVKDPAIKWFADYLGQVTTRTQGLEAKLWNMERASQQAAEQEALRVTRWGVDSFAQQKDEKGQLLHPYFDRVIDEVMELYAANPKYDMNTAYKKACRMNDAVWGEIQQREAQAAVKVVTDQRAAQAARLNVRGRTSPVSAPNGADHGPRSLRDTIEATADELGL